MENEFSDRKNDVILFLASCHRKLNPNLSESQILLHLMYSRKDQHYLQPAPLLVEKVASTLEQVPTYFFLTLTKSNPLRIWRRKKILIRLSFKADRSRSEGTEIDKMDYKINVESLYQYLCRSRLFVCSTLCVSMCQIDNHLHNENSRAYDEIPHNQREFVWCHPTRPWYWLRCYRPRLALNNSKHFIIDLVCAFYIGQH